MAMGYVMTSMPALAPSMNAASATVLVDLQTAVVRRFQQVIAIVMAISLMPMGVCGGDCQYADADADGTLR